MNARYGSERVSRGLAHFLTGKALSATCGFISMVLVVRLLSVEDFADYSVLVALVEIATALSGLGISHVVLRYVPELYAKHYIVALHRLIVAALSMRLCSLMLVVFLAWAFTPIGAPLIGMEDATDSVRIFLYLVFVRIAGYFLAQIIESTLNQGIAQIGYSIAGISRLIGMFMLMNADNASLNDVIWIEIASEILCLAVMLYGVYRIIWAHATQTAPEDDQIWIGKNSRQIVRFALAGYIQHIVVLPFGGNTNRLVGGSMFNDITMANFGFAQTLYEYMKRYLPAQFLVGIVRPILVARYSKHRDFTRAAGICEGIALINAVLIVGMMSLLLIGGAETLSHISNGKYGSEAAILLGVLLLVVYLETHRLMLELLVQAVERYDLLIPSNILLSASIIPAILAFPSFGVLCFPLANAAALVVSNILVQRKLFMLGYKYTVGWTALLKLMIVCLLDFVVGMALIQYGLHWATVMAISIVLYSLIVWKLYQCRIRVLLSDLLVEKNADRNTAF